MLEISKYLSQSSGDMLEIGCLLDVSWYKKISQAYDPQCSDQSINRLRNKQTDDEIFLVLSKPLTIEHLQCNIFF